MTIETLKPLRLSEIDKEQEQENLDSTPVEHGWNRTLTSQDGIALDESNNTMPSEELK